MTGTAPAAAKYPRSREKHNWAFFPLPRTMSDSTKPNQAKERTGPNGGYTFSRSPRVKYYRPVLA